MPRGTSQAEIRHMTFGTAKQHSHVAISALKPDAVPNSLPMKNLKPVKPVIF
jgi:hypothetical protein